MGNFYCSYCEINFKNDQRVFVILGCLDIIGRVVEIGEQIKCKV